MRQRERPREKVMTTATEDEGKDDATTRVKMTTSTMTTTQVTVTTSPTTRVTVGGRKGEDGERFKVTRVGLRELAR